MANETQADRLALVSSVLQDVYNNLQRTRQERSLMEKTSLSFHQATGKIRAYVEIVDVFTGLGFSIGEE